MLVQCYNDVLNNCIQSTLVISKSKGPAETLRDIRTSTYQMCRTEEIQPNFTNEHVILLLLLKI